MADPVLGNVAVDDVYQCQFAATLFNQRIRTVLHFRVTEAPTAAQDRWAFYTTLGQYLTTVDPASLYTALRGCQSDDVSYNYLQVQAILPQRLVYRRFPLGQTGSIADSIGSLNYGGYILKKTSFAGRDAIGSVHVAGLPVDTSGGDLWNIDTQDNLDNLASFIRAEAFDDIAGWRAVPCLAPRRGSVVLPFLVTAAEASAQVRTMRRRTVGVGE